MADFSSEYYGQFYFADLQGKEFRRPDGTVGYWGYRNPDGFWDGCFPIAKAWKEVFKLERCNTDTGFCKSLDFGAGRGQFIWALRTLGVEAWGFDFSEWAIKNRYKGCQEGWIIKWDAAVGWPYGDKAFDLVLGLDIMEHIYQEDLDFVISEMFRVSKKWVFLQIAVCGSGGLQGESQFQGYMLNKEESIPVELESVAVAGHVTIQSKEFWVNRLLKDNNGIDRKWILRDDLVNEFVKKVDPLVIENWIKNSILVLERID